MFLAFNLSVIKQTGKTVCLL